MIKKIKKETLSVEKEEGITPIS